MKRKRRLESSETGAKRNADATCHETSNGSPGAAKWGDATFAVAARAIAAVFLAAGVLKLDALLDGELAWTTLAIPVEVVVSVWVLLRPRSELALAAIGVIAASASAYAVALVNAGTQLATCKCFGAIQVPGSDRAHLLLNAVLVLASAACWLRTVCSTQGIYGDSPVS